MSRDDGKIHETTNTDARLRTNSKHYHVILARALISVRHFEVVFTG